MNVAIVIRYYTPEDWAIAAVFRTRAQAETWITNNPLPDMGRYENPYSIEEWPLGSPDHVHAAT